MKFNYQQFRNNQQSFISSDGEIKYTDKGKGSVILLIHGIPTSSWLYRKMIDGLVAEGHRVIAPDMLGFGASENPKGYEVYSQENHAKRIVELMDHLKIDSWSHVMHDAGGLWTWETFKKVPSRINRLIILNTIIYKEGFNPPIKMTRGPFARFSMWLYRNKSTTNTLLDQLFKKGMNHNELTEEEIEGYKMPLQEGKTNAMYYFFTNTCNELTDYDSLLNSINIPVTVIWGKNDDMLEWEPQKEKVQKSLKIKNENIHTLDGRHFIQEGFPEQINEIIINFMKNNN